MKYQKKHTIDAFQMTQERRQDNSDWPEWMHDAWNRGTAYINGIWPSQYPYSDGKDPLNIRGHKGTIPIRWNDWIIKNEHGELSVMNLKDFEYYYASVEETVIEKLTTERDNQYEENVNLIANNAELLAALAEHNCALRSSYAVIKRRGESTNWEALDSRVIGVLTQHHKISTLARVSVVYDFMEFEHNGN